MVLRAKSLHRPIVRTDGDLAAAVPAIVLHVFKPPSQARDARQAYAEKAQHGTRDSVEISASHEDCHEARARTDVRLHAGADFGHSDRCSPLAEGAVDYVSLVDEIVKGRHSCRVRYLIDRRG